jgi:hypothetical protein
MTVHWRLQRVLGGGRARSRPPCTVWWREHHQSISLEWHLVTAIEALVSVRFDGTIANGMNTCAGVVGEKPPKDRPYGPSF